MEVDIDHLRGWIGNQDVTSEIVTPALVNRFGAVFDQSLDATPGAACPSLIHLCLGQPTAASRSLAIDGHPKRVGFLPPVPLPRRMWASGSFVIHDAIFVGETVTRRSKIKDVVLKEGRSGKLCFVSIEHHVTSADRHVLTEQQIIVYRDADTGTKPSITLPVAPEGAYTRSVTPTTPLLFRYSALTFNSTVALSIRFGDICHFLLPSFANVTPFPLQAPSLSA